MIYCNYSSKQKECHKICQKYRLPERSATFMPGRKSGCQTFIHNVRRLASQNVGITARQKEIESYVRDYVRTCVGTSCRFDGRTSVEIHCRTHIRTKVGPRVTAHVRVLRTGLVREHMSEVHARIRKPTRTPEHVPEHVPAFLIISCVRTHTRLDAKRL